MDQSFDRAFFREFYKDVDPYPVASDECNGLVVEMKEAVDLFPIEFSLPPTMNETTYRIREQIEELLDIPFIKSADSAKSATNNSNASCNANSNANSNCTNSNPTHSGASVSPEFASLFRECAVSVANYEDWAFRLVNTNVELYLPHDFRMTLLNYKRDRDEKALAKQVADMMAKGASIKEKYNMLWAHQMKRRQALVDIGNASGVLKWIVQHLVGVPPSLFAFMRTINDDLGPMEEIRLKYAPSYSEVLQFTFETRRFAASMVRRNQVTEKNLDLLMRAAKICHRDTRGFLHMFKHEVFGTMPFFAKKLDDTNSDSNAAPTYDKSATINAGDAFEETVHVEEENGCILNVSFRCSKDIDLVIEPGILASKNCPATHSETVTLPKKGTYTVTFSNQKSWISKKTLEYSIIKT